MKNILLIITILLSFNQSYSQLIQKDNQLLGYGKFILGETIANYSASVIEGGTFYKNGRQYDHFAYNLPNGETIEVENIKSNSLILVGNDSNKVVKFTFFKFYKKAEIPKYKRKANEDYKKLAGTISKELTTKAKKESVNRQENIYGGNNSYTTTGNGLKWDLGLSSLIIRIIHSPYHSAIEIEISYN